MESFFSRYRNALVLITVLMVQVVGLAVQVRRPGPNPSDKGSVRLIRSWAVGLVTPPERVLRATGRGIRSVWMNYIDLIHVRQQNRNLKAQLDNLRLEEESLAEDARQGQRLQALLGFREKYIYKTVAAQVIGTSGTEQSRVLLIDKGSRDGLKPDMPVITPDGIVGKTRDVFAHTSQVLEISDPTSGAGVLLETTRIRGVLRGNSWGQPEIVNISPDERIQKGEAVITSGGDEIYPRGLAVGTVQRVVPDPDGTLVSVLIRPAANLARLEEVLIITSTGDTMPSQMQQDLSDAQQKASEVLAQRLPSRNDPNAPPGQQNPQAQQDNSKPTPTPVQAPRPLQALHPDRYTPLDTPPAADLVPGQRFALETPSVAAPSESARPHSPDGTQTSGDKPQKTAGTSSKLQTQAASSKAQENASASPGKASETPGAKGAAGKSARPPEKPAAAPVPSGTQPSTPADGNPQGGA